MATALFCVTHSVDYITQGLDRLSQEQLIIQVFRNAIAVVSTILVVDTVTVVDVGVFIIFN